MIKDEVVIVNGRIDRREEEISLVIETISVFDPNNLPSPSRFVEIYVPKGTQVAVLQNINKTLRTYPGEVPVTLLLPNGGTELTRLNLPFTISPDPLLEDEIKKLLGTDSFRVV